MICVPISLGGEFWSQWIDIGGMPSQTSKLGRSGWDEADGGGLTEEDKGHQVMRTSLDHNRQTGL